MEVADKLWYNYNSGYFEHCNLVVGKSRFDGKDGLQFKSFKHNFPALPKTTGLNIGIDSLIELQTHKICYSEK